MAMIPLIAVSAVVQMAMMTGGYGDNEVSHRMVLPQGGSARVIDPSLVSKLATFEHYVTFHYVSAS